MTLNTASISVWQLIQWYLTPWLMGPDFVLDITKKDRLVLHVMPLWLPAQWWLGVKIQFVYPGSAKLHSGSCVRICLYHRTWITTVRSANFANRTHQKLTSAVPMHILFLQPFRLNFTDWDNFGATETHYNEAAIRIATVNGLACTFQFDDLKILVPEAEYARGVIDGQRFRFSSSTKLARYLVVKVEDMVPVYVLIACPESIFLFPDKVPGTQSAVVSKLPIQKIQ